MNFNHFGTILTLILSIVIVDGDTFKIGNQYYRLYGIDAPELDQPYGDMSKANLSLLDIKRFETIGNDRYGREIVIVEGVAEELLRTGSAWIAPRYCHLPICTEWKAVEKGAREAHIGLWSEGAIEPWEWRKMNH